MEYDWKSATPSVDHEGEKEELRKEIDGLENKVAALEEALDIKEAATIELSKFMFSRIAMYFCSVDTLLIMGIYRF